MQVHFTYQKFECAQTGRFCICFEIFLTLGTIDVQELALDVQF